MPPLISQERKEDLKRQIWSANVRGMRPDEIAKSFELSIGMTKNLLREATAERVEEYREDEKDNEDASMVFLLDHIQFLRSRLYSTITHYNKQGKSNGIPALYASMIHLVEIESKVKGLMPTKVTGPDGHGPIEIMAVTDRQAAIEEIKARLEQEERLSEQRLLDATDDQ